MPSTSKNEQKAGQSRIPLIIGTLVFAGIILFLAWGTWHALHPGKVPLQGLVDARTIAVSAKVTGRIEKLRVREGDRIKAGDPVAVISIPEIEAKFAQAKAQQEAAKAQESKSQTGSRVQEKQAARAEWERARASLELAQKTYRRIHALYADGLVSAQRHDEASAQLAAAQKLAAAAQARMNQIDEGSRKEDIAAAEARVRQAEGGVAEVASLVEESDVRSPVQGEVTRLVMEEGELTPAGYPIVLVTDLSDKWVVFNVREDELPGIEVGSEMTARIPALGKDVRVRVYWINPRGEYATWRATRQNTGYDLRTFEVRARAEKDLPAMRPGMSVIIER